MAALSGQTALVTGGSSGIGAAVAQALAQAGAAVGINYAGRKDKADEIAAEIRTRGGKALLLKADVSSEKSVLAMFDKFIAEFGRLDILVANAGLQQDANITDMTLAQWRKVLDVNLTGTFLCARAAIRQFLRQGGSPISKATGKIICMSSVHQRIPWAGHCNYAASKGGMMLLMQSLAQEMAGKKIRINSLAPGAIRTPINKQEWSSPRKKKDLLKLIPYGRIGEPADVANAALWLASDESDYVTGATLFIDGGMALYPGFRGHG